MAPTPEDVIDSLKSTVDKLEARVAELEGRLKGSAGSSSSPNSGSDGMRMILIGPPGAGKRVLLPLQFSRHTGFCCASWVEREECTDLSLWHRQRNTRTMDQGQV